MAYQSNFYTVGSSRTYVATKTIITKSHMAVWVKIPDDGVTIPSEQWSQLAYDKFDLINNSAVVHKDVVLTQYEQIEIRVADEPNELEQSPSDISVVAGIADEIVDVAFIDEKVVAVAGIKDEVANVGSEPLMSAILDAENNATIATDKAAEASTSADEALASKNAAAVSETNALESETNAKASELAAADSANNADLFNYRVTTKSAQLSGEFKLKTEVEKNGASTVLYTGQSNSQDESKPELVTNGKDFIDINGWTEMNGHTATVENGLIKGVCGGSTADSVLQQTISLSANIEYRFDGVGADGTDDQYFVVYESDGTTILYNSNGNGDNIGEFNYTPTVDKDIIVSLNGLFSSGETGNTIYMKSASVKESVTALPEETGEYYWDNTNLHINNGIDYATASDRVMVLAQWNNTETYNTGDERRFQRENRWFRVVYLQDGITGVANNPALMFDFADDTLFEKMQIDSETKGGRVWTKERNNSGNHIITDTLRGKEFAILSDDNIASISIPNNITAFNTNGFTLGLSDASNQDGIATVSWGLGTTHVKSMIENGVPQIVEWNPKTLFGMCKRKGSNSPVESWRPFEVVYQETKNLTLGGENGHGIVYYGKEDSYLHLYSNTHGDNASASIDGFFKSNPASFDFSVNVLINNSGSTYIDYFYGQAYKDDNNELNGIFDFGIYGGTWNTGKLTDTIAKLAYWMVKGVTTATGYITWDTPRLPNRYIYPDKPDAESINYIIDFREDGVYDPQGTSGHLNGANEQYFYMGIIDNDNGSGQSTYLEENNTGVIKATNLVLSYSDGATDNTIKEFGDIDISNVQWELD